jgi:molecular chaperone GrpE
VSSEEREQEPVVIRDNRKIDPLTGEARKPAASTEATPSADLPGEATADEAILDAATAALLAERTADLQRVQAEYANYRKRADRERAAAGDVAISSVLSALLPVLDNLDRAREHGDLTGALKAVADQLDSVFERLGLEAFGAVGDPFDPAIHEAVLHDESDEVTVPTATTVMRPGYMHGERLLRPAMVGVSDPVNPPPAVQAEAADDISGESATTNE